jgi:hypothetical protein
MCLICIHYLLGVNVITSILLLRPNMRGETAICYGDRGQEHSIVLCPLGYAAKILPSRSNPKHMFVDT